MNKYENVTFLEYQKKRHEMFDNLGRIGGICDGIDCCICPLYKGNNGTNLECREMEHLEPEKALEIVMEYKPKIDWENVPVDAKILVKLREDDTWLKRYFAKYENGKVYAWNNGATSFSADNNKYYVADWKYAKLYKEEERQ